MTYIDLELDLNSSNKSEVQANGWKKIKLNMFLVPTKITSFVPTKNLFTFNPYLHL